MKGELLSSFTKHEENLFLTLQVSKPVLEQAPLLIDILDLLAWSGNSFMGISLMAAILNKKEPELYNPLNLGGIFAFAAKSPGWGALRHSPPSPPGTARAISHYQSSSMD